MSYKLHFNPSTLTLSYDLANKKLQMLQEILTGCPETICITFNGIRNCSDDSIIAALDGYTVELDRTEDMGTHWGYQVDKMIGYGGGYYLSTFCYKDGSGFVVEIISTSGYPNYYTEFVVGYNPYGEKVGFGENANGLVIGDCGDTAYFGRTYVIDGYGGTVTISEGACP